MINPFHDAAHCVWERANEDLEMEAHAKRRDSSGNRTSAGAGCASLYPSHGPVSEPISSSFPEPTRAFLDSQSHPASYCLHPLYLVHT